MQTSTIRLLASAFFMQVLSLGALPAQAQAPNTAMAPVTQYLMPSASAEVALARSAAPASISGAAEVLVLKRDGYTTAAKGTNGFVCLVERSFAAATGDSVFWDPNIRGPNCVNPAAARTYLPAVLMKARLALAGRSKTQIAQAVASAMDSKKLPALEPGAMSYMMSRQQYLGAAGKHWHPHVMVFVSGDAAKRWGADLPGSPIMAANDPETRMTIFFIWAGHWSDGTPAPQ
jgi:hypothetical protein